MELDEFEKDILETVDADEWVSTDSLESRITELQANLKNQQKKLISIRVPEQDLYEVKRRALESGIPYQNLMQILIHQYASNKIQLTV